MKLESQRDVVLKIGDPGAALHGLKSFAFKTCTFSGTTVS